MEQEWDQAIELNLGGPGRYRTVRSTEEAAVCLMERWPTATGEAYLEAQKACLAGLEGSLPSESVRLAFIDAAVEANIHIRSFSDPRDIAMGKRSR